jgi:heptosyltransferase I
MCRAQFVVSNDSGPMHITAALGTIFDPTDSTRTGPYGEGLTIIKSDTPCALCFKKSCDDMKCMKGVSANEVFETITAKKVPTQTAYNVKFFRSLRINKL